MADNQLLSEAAAGPDVDEYTGMSIVDICHAAINWPEGSEDQRRAIRAIQARQPGIGHNRPPLAEQLAEELAPHRATQARMIELAGKALIIDEESAAKVTDLGIQVKTLEDELKKSRDEKKRPYLVALDLIDSQYDPLIIPLVAARGDRMTGLRGMLTAFIRKRDEAAAAAQREAAAAQAQREAAAAEARRKADEARQAGKGAVGAELAALAAEDEAEEAKTRAAAVRPAPIRTALGQVQTQRYIECDLEEAGLRPAVLWMLKQPPLAAKLSIQVVTIAKAYARGLGVQTVAEGGVKIPGLKIWISVSAGGRR